MNARITKAEAALLTPNPPSRSAVQVQAHHFAAPRDQDKAAVNALGQVARRTGEALAALAGAVLTWPARRAAYDRLMRMTDRELADIGLTRADIPRVLVSGSANDNAPRRAA